VVAFLGSVEHHPSVGQPVFIFFYLTSCLKENTCHDFGNTDGRPGAYLPGVQRTSSAVSTSKFDNIACRTGVRRGSHQPGWKSGRPTAWPLPIRDRQDDICRQQEVGGHQSRTAGGSGRELRKQIGNGGVEGLGRTPDSIGISHAGASVGYRRLPARPQRDDDDRRLPGH